MVRTLIAGTALMLSAACGGDRGTPSAEQNAAMNEAGEMLDRAPESLSEIDDSALRNQPDAVSTNAP
jgi:hypothetical protein